MSPRGALSVGLPNKSLYKFIISSVSTAQRKPQHCMAGNQSSVRLWNFATSDQAGHTS
jgi:hypothetical protein